MRKEPCGCPRCNAHAAGNKGPFSPSEFMAFAETKEELPAELPPEVITAGIEADAALDDFTVARDAVDEIGLLVIRAQTKGASRDELARLQRAWEAAREELAEPEERLQKARRAYSEARQSYEARRNWAEQVAMADANTAAKNEERSTRNRRLVREVIGRGRR